MEKIEVSAEAEGLRIDKFLSEKYSDISRSWVQSCVKAGKVRVNGSVTKANYKLKPGDCLELDDLSVPELVLEAEECDLKIVHEEDSYFVIEKPAGVVVHPGDGQSHTTGTVANKVKSLVDQGVGPEMRPGIVHRLDQDTSGLLIIAKNRVAYEYFLNVFKERKIEKRYLAMLCGTPKPDFGVVDAPIGRNLRSRKEMTVVSEREGKAARSEYALKQVFDCDLGEVSLVEVKIETGRTHQIRVHMSAVGFPVLGDDIYGKRAFNKHFRKVYNLNRHFLHAYSLKFKSPGTGDLIEIESDLPEDLESVINNLN